MKFYPFDLDGFRYHCPYDFLWFRTSYLPGRPSVAVLREGDAQAVIDGVIQTVVVTSELNALA